MSIDYRKKLREEYYKNVCSIDNISNNLAFYEWCMVIENQYRKETNNECGFISDKNIYEFYLKLKLIEIKAYDLQKKSYTTFLTLFKG